MTPPDRVQHSLASLIAAATELSAALAEDPRGGLALLAEPEPKCPLPMDTTKPMMMTLKELAAELQIHPRTLWRMLAAGQGPKPIKLGRTTRFSRAAVERWIARREG